MDNNVPTDSTTEVGSSDFDVISAALFGNEVEENAIEEIAEPDAAASPTIEAEEEATIDENAEQPVAVTVEPPKSWTAEEREAFKLLPPDVQKTLSERDAKRNADISNKFNEVNEQKKAVEQERQKTLTERAQYVQALENQTNFIQMELGKKYGHIDVVKMASENPSEYVKMQAEYARDKSQLENTYSQLAQARNVQTEEAKQAYQHYIAEQNEKLGEFIPEWKDTNRRTAIKSDMVGYLTKSYGFTSTELESLVDAREASIAYKAFLYDKAQAEFKSKKVSTAPKVQNPTVNQTQGRGEQVGLNNKAKTTLRNTNNTRTQASIIADLI
jgi:hypothetical protein